MQRYAFIVNKWECKEQPLEMTELYSLDGNRTYVRPQAAKEKSVDKYFQLKPENEPENSHV